MNILDKENNYIENLIHEYLEGTITPKDKDELFRWIIQDTANLTYFNQISDIWLSSSVFQDTQNFNTDDAFGRVKAKIEDINDLSKPKSKLIRLSLLKAAAILVPIIFISGLVSKLIFSDNVQYTESPFLFEVPYGSKSTVTLPDKSVVVLNSGSKLTFREGFGHTHRLLNLTGEAYFKVAKNKDLAFVVHAGNLNVRALGTEFNVKAYPEDKNIETTLIQGSIQVNRDSKGKADIPLILLPKQRLVYNKQFDSIQVNMPAIEKQSPGKILQSAPSPKVKYAKAEIDPVVFTSWKDVSWIIYRKNLNDLAIELERKYDVKINFGSEELKTIKFTGTLRNESLEQVLSAIRLAAPIEFNVKGKIVELKENKELMHEYKQYYSK